MVVLIFDPITQEQRQADLCESKASLVYIVSFRTATAVTQRNAVLKNKRKKKQKRKTNTVVVNSEILNALLSFIHHPFSLVSHKEIELQMLTWTNITQ